MAQVNTSDAFPSVKLLSTDSQGELGEVTQTDATYSSVTILSDVVITAKTAGALDPALSIQVSDAQGGTDVVEYNNGAIHVKYADAFTANAPATSDEVNYNGAFDVTAVQAGDLGVLQLIVTDNNGGSDEVKLLSGDNDISVCLSQDIANYTNQDIYDLLTDSANAGYNSGITSVATFGALTNGASLAVTGVFSLTGGTDASGAIPAQGTAGIVALINGSSNVNQIVEATGGSAAVPSAVSQTSFDAGLDGTTADLDPSSDYLCIKLSDIHSMTNTETDDARKLVWGMLESYYDHVSGLPVADQPSNFVVAKGNLALINEGGVNKLRHTYTANAFYSIGSQDLDSE